VWLSPEHQLLFLLIFPCGGLMTCGFYNNLKLLTNKGAVPDYNKGRMRPYNQNLFSLVSTVHQLSSIPCTISIQKNQVLLLKSVRIIWQ
jgi:hypothetical protein